MAETQAKESSLIKKVGQLADIMAGVLALVLPIT